MSGRKLNINRPQIRKILVIKPAAIGDVLLSTPVVENLRHNFPDAEIVFLTQKYCKEILTGNPFLDRVLTYDLSIDSGYCLIRNIRKQHYDLVLDLFSNPRTALITFLSGAKYRVGYRFRGRAYAYNIKVSPRGGEVHNTEFNLDSLRAIGLDIITNKPFFKLNPVHYEFAEAFFSKNGLEGNGVIGINPCGTWPTKVWYREKFIEVIRKLVPDYKVLLFWGYDNELSEAEIIKKEAGNDVHLIPEADLKHTGALIRKCRLFLTNDTGPMHIAWVLGTPVAAIFGPTNPELQGPLARNSAVIRNETLSCLGCNLTRLEECPYEHKCMRDLEAEEVFRKLSGLLKNSGVE